MNKFKQASLMAVAISGVVASAQPAFAQGGEAAELEEVVIMGSRSNKPRSATDSTVPVDVLSSLFPHNAMLISWFMNYLFLFFSYFFLRRR